MALSNAANWGRHAFQRAVKCSTFPLDTERQRGSGEILPSLFLSLFPSSVSLLHGSQDALCGGCGPWPLCQPSHSPWADHQHPEHSVLLDPLSKHTELIKLFNFPTDAAAFLSSSCLLSSLSLLPALSSRLCFFFTYPTVNQTISAGRSEFIDIICVCHSWW